MTRKISLAALAISVVVPIIVSLHAQGRGGSEWTTAQGDAQRTSWVRTDARISAASLGTPGFQFLWKMKLHNEPKQLNSLTTPVLLDRLVGFRGFKAIAVVGASADTMYAVDYDLARPLWTAVLNYSGDNAVPPSSMTCPGGLMASATRPTAAAPAVPGAGGGGGRAGGRSGSSVGEPGRGAPNLAIAGQGRGQQPPAAGAPGAGRPGGAGAAAGAPGAPGGGGGGGGRGGPLIMGQTDAFYAMGSDGYVHALNVSNGADLFPPVKFIPENAKPSSLLLVDGMLYTSTSGGCGATPNGVWAIELTSPNRKTLVWETNGGGVVGASGPTLGTSGLLFAAVGNGTGGHSNSVVALDAKTLALKDWITVPGADFNSSPVVFRYKDKELVAVSGNDGKLYLLDGASLGGSTHAAAMFVTPKFSGPMPTSGLSTWETRPPAAPAGAAGAAAPPTPGTRWILAPAAGAVPAALKVTANGVAPNGGIVAFKLVEQGGALTLAPTWASRDMTSALTPLVVNDVVFAVSSGEFRGAASANMTAAQRAQRSAPAVLYALDAATGKELWSSGKQITSFARSGLSAGGSNGSQLFVTTYDSTLYAFGFPIEK